MARVLFICDVVELVDRPNYWQPAMLDVYNSVGPFPLVWSIERTRNLAVGLADVTAAQQTAINADARIRTRPYADLVQRFDTLSVAQRNALRTYLESKGLTAGDAETFQEILTRALQVGQPGWTWSTIENMLAQNWGV